MKTITYIKERINELSYQITSVRDDLIHYVDSNNHIKTVAKETELHGLKERKAEAESILKQLQGRA
jgi:hypothetical protein